MKKQILSAIASTIITIANGNVSSVTTLISKIKNSATKTIGTTAHLQVAVNKL